MYTHAHVLPSGCLQMHSLSTSALNYRFKLKNCKVLYECQLSGESSWGKQLLNLIGAEKRHLSILAKNCLTLSKFLTKFAAT